MKLIHLVVAAFIFFVSVETHAGDCAYHNFDVWKVSKAVQQGLSKETLLLHLEGSKNELTEDRMEGIKKLIDEAYQLDPMTVEQWRQKLYRKCEDERES